MSCTTVVIKPYKWEKPLKQGKVDRYSIDLTDWLGEDELATVVSTSNKGFTSIIGSGIANKSATVTLTGVNPGLDEIRISVSTNTGRTEGIIVQLVVVKYP
jgi:hypothetical protein